MTTDRRDDHLPSDDITEHFDTARRIAGVSMVSISDADAIDAILERVTSAVASTLEVPGVVARLAEDPRRSHTESLVMSDIEDVQSSSLQGPCFDAMATCAVVTSEHLTSDERWPALHEIAARNAVHSAMSVPMRSGDTCVGAVTAYGHAAHRFGERELDILEALSMHAASAIANVQLYRATVDLADGLEAAMATRATIEQAKGMLMLRHGCSADEAFDILRQSSQRMNVKLNALAESIVSKAVRKGE